MLAQSKTPLKSPSCRIERDSEETAAARAAASIEKEIAMFFSWFLILFIVFLSPGSLVGRHSTSPEA